MRAGDPATAVAAFVAAGRAPADPGERRPDGRREDLRHHRRRRRPRGRRRGRRRDRPQPRPGHAARAGPGRSRRPRAPRPRTPLRGRTVRIVAVTADATPDAIDALLRAVDPDVVQLSGEEPPEPGRDPATDLEGAARAARRRRRADRGGPGGHRTRPRVHRRRHRGAPPRHSRRAPSRRHGQRADESVARLVARELPITLAGGLTAGERGRRAALAFPRRRGRRQRGGSAPRPRRAAAEGPVPGRALREACPRRATRPAARARRPTPVDPGLLDADDRGRWGADREFGGRYVPETLMAAIRRAGGGAGRELRTDPRFWAELRELLERYAGRPTPLYRADRLAAETLADVADRAGGGRALRGLRLYLKREDLAHTGAHKINNALGPGAADASPRQDPRHRRDRCRPARRRDGDRVRAARAAVRRLHGRRGHRAPAPERAPDGRPRRRGPIRSPAAARRSRTRSTRRCATGSRTSRRPTTCIGSAMGPHPVPDARPRPPADDR